jgi:nitrate/nitrite transporter NarK
LVVAIGMGTATMVESPAAQMLAFSLACFGIFGSMPVFWTLPTAFLSGTAAAGGIAMINSIANLAGFAGPYAMGWIKDATGSYTGGLLLLAAVAMIAMFIVLALGHDRSLERSADALDPIP